MVPLPSGFSISPKNTERIPAIVRMPGHMGFFYRKSVNFGPFRVNLGKSGVGYSVGGRGFRVGRSARGRRYTAFSLPGTGLGYRGSGCLLLIAAIPASITLIAFIQATFC